MSSQDRPPHWRSKPHRRWTIWALPLVAAGAALGWRSRSVTDVADHWMLVASDSSYTIWLDTTRISRLYTRIYEVWYRTDHREPRYYRNAEFNRETVQIQIACRQLQFKVVSTTLSMRGRRNVIHQENTSREVSQQTWHPVDPGTTDADAAGATCNIADARWRRR
jgi:hypothetical protein